MRRLILFCLLSLVVIGVGAAETEKAAVPAKDLHLEGRGTVLPRKDLDDRGPIAAAAPPLSTPSLTIDQQLHMGTDSSVFKEGLLLMWEDGTNSAVGRNALGANASGTSNTALGSFALTSNTSGMFNTAVGDIALSSNYSGERNTAVGGFALRANVYGSHNTAVGLAAMEYNEFGSGNTAVGSGALALNTGSENTALGYLALLNNTNAYFNTAVGGSALKNHVTGADNVAVGWGALFDNTEGLRNLALGTAAGFYALGSDNVLLNNFGVDTDSNILRIGMGTGTGYYQLDKAYIQGISGNTIAGGEAVYIDASTGQLGTAAVSSRSKKSNIRPIGTASARLHELEPVTFEFNNRAEGGLTMPEFGLIAEDVASVLPELVVFSDAGDPEGVRYRLLTPMLLNEVQRQHRQIRQLQLLLALGFVVVAGWVATRLVVHR